MSTHRPICIVLGAGVIGLTTALRLVEQGWEVHIVAEEVAGKHGVAFSTSILAHTTSSGAGAVWEFPPFSVEPQSKAREWVLQGRKIFEHLSMHKETGVRMSPHVIVARTSLNVLETINEFRKWSFLYQDFGAGLIQDFLDKKDSSEILEALKETDLRHFSSFNCYTSASFYG